MAVSAPGALKDRPTTKAQVRYVRMSASKARVVLDLIRGKSVSEADEVLILSERDPALVIQKCLRSAVANAEHNDGLDPDELFVATCFADEGPTLRRFRPRARGRATRIRKRTCHITVVVSRYSDEQLAARGERERAKGSSGGRSSDAASRRRRVARSRGEEAPAEEPTVDEEAVDEEAFDAEAVDEELLEETSDAVEETPTDEETSDEVEETPPDEADEVVAASGSADELTEAHTKDELLALAEAAGIEVAKSWTKPQIAEAIVAAREDS